MEVCLLSLPMAQSRKQALLIFAIGCTVAGLGWSAIYAYTGYRLAAYLPAIFSLTLGLALIAYRWLGWIRPLLFAQLFMILIIPTLLQWSLGGFSASGVVILWALLSPVGALVLTHWKQALAWLLALFVALGLSLALDPMLAQRMGERAATGGVQQFFFGMNFLGVSAVVFAALMFYNASLAGEQKVRESLLELLDRGAEQLGRSMQDLASGNLKPEIVSAEFQNQSSLSRIFQSLDDATALMRNQFLSIDRSSDELEAALKEISGTIQDLLFALQSETAQIQQTEAALDNLRKENKAITASLQEGSRALTENVSAAGEARQTLTSTLSRWKTLSESIGRSSEEIRGLQDRADSIARILDIIHEVAERTSLLSLNASIEAARAGDSGRGFAVVAQQIGSLALSAQDSAARIEAEVQEIIGSIHRTYQEFQQHREAMNQGLQSSAAAESIIKDFMERYRNLLRLYRRMEKRSHSQQEAIGLLDGDAQQILDGMKTLVAFHGALGECNRRLEDSVQAIRESLDRFRL
ncbi:MAG: hypothetical protein KDK23_12360 [Leptospiraceae bacterium]|nr:hypothetical protein [Leptospiraceae bacterium]